MTHSLRVQVSLPLRFLTVVTAAVALLTPYTGARAQGSGLTISDADFWKFFVAMSEPDGYFLSDNFVSNELGYQHVIPALRKSLTADGVYLGVGPEQNFTYIANLSPRLAVIFDVRRQNAMQHLMYKAIFELSPSRAEFVARLFSRPAVRHLATPLPVKALFDSAAAAVPDDSAFSANRRAIFSLLRESHGFALSPDDSASIDYVYQAFFAAGPSINYGYRPGVPGFARTTYPGFGALQAAVNADSVQISFLATEPAYRAVRDMQLRNLVIPVVADFAGPSAIRAVGDYLRKRRLTVTAFYVSNVEQYLFRDGNAWERFYGNVSALPLDSTSTFIRSVPGSGGSIMNFSMGLSGTGSVPTGAGFVIYRDSMGVRTVTTTRDSAGQRVTRSTRDTTTTASAAPDTSLAAQLRAMVARRDSITRANISWVTTVSGGGRIAGGGMLASGLFGLAFIHLLLGELQALRAAPIEGESRRL